MGIGKRQNKQVHTMSSRRSINIGQDEEAVIIDFIKSNISPLQRTISKKLWESLSSKFQEMGFPNRTPISLKNHFWRKINPAHHLIQQRNSITTNELPRSECSTSTAAAPTPETELQVSSDLYGNTLLLEQEPKEDMSLFSLMLSSQDDQETTADSPQELMVTEDLFSQSEDSDLEVMEVESDTDSDDFGDLMDDNVSDFGRKVKYLAFVHKMELEDFCKLVFMTGDLRIASELARGKYAKYYGKIWSESDDL